MNENSNNNELMSSPSPVSDSTTNISVETIIDTLNVDNQSNTMLNSANNNNDNNKNSLSNSQISIITKERTTTNTSGNINLRKHNNNSHLYNIPDNLLLLKDKNNKVLSNEMLEVSHNPNINNNNNNNKNNNNKHNTKNNNNNNNNNASVSSSLTLIPTTKSTINKKFTINILLGIIQLLLSITLTALGGLILARGASLGYTCSGIWAGGICGIAGALGVINVRKIQTAFLAVSLICVASSTLALALTGIGMVRDINLGSSKGEISAGAGLIFALFLHFIVSVLSVYYSAMNLCSRHASTKLLNAQLLENAIITNNSTLLSQQRVENYIKSMSAEQNLKGLQSNAFHKNMIRNGSGSGGGTGINTTNEKFDSLNNHEKLMALWLGKGKVPAISSQSTHSLPPNPHPNYNNNNNNNNHGHYGHRQIVLVPAGYGNGYPIIPMYPPTGSLPPPPPPTPSMIYSTSLPPAPPSSSSYHYNQLNYPPEILEQFHRHRSTTAPLRREKQRRQQQQQQQQQQRYHEKRRKSDSEMENRKSTAFIYTGLDRSIAESFLKQQEKMNNGSSNLDAVDLKNDNNIDNKKYYGDIAI